MKTYVVAFYNLLGNYHNIAKIMAENATDALLIYLLEYESKWAEIINAMREDGNEITVEDVREWVNDCDCSIVFMEI